MRYENENKNLEIIFIKIKIKNIRVINIFISEKCQYGQKQKQNWAISCSLQFHDLLPIFDGSSVFPSWCPNGRKLLLH